MQALGCLRPILDLKYLSYVILGPIIYSIGFNVFILPCGLYNGGFIGLVQIILYLAEEVLHLPLGEDNYNGLLYFLLNLPLLYAAAKRFGREFILRSALLITTYSIALAWVPIPARSLLPDMLTACIAGGVFCGLGCGLTLMSKGSGGGEGILGLLLMQKFKGLSIGTVFNILNVLVFIFCAYCYDLSVAVYSIFFNVITSTILDKVYLPSITVAMFIVTKRTGVDQLVFSTVHRGVTKLQGVGAYSGEQAEILLTVVSKAEARLLRKTLLEYDENIFIIEENAGITGNFEKRL